MKEIIPSERILNKIYLIRDVKVMIDRDLADLYGVKTHRLNEQVKRNKKRFPSDFMFRLNNKEKDELIANCDRFESLKHSTSNPLAFTEQGVAMLSSVLSSDKAIQVNIQIMRAFTQFKKMFASQENVLHKLKELENKYIKHDEEIEEIFKAIRYMMVEEKKSKRKIGFDE